jgi:indolepyruvate ferredoxin oxidoreductase
LNRWVDAAACTAALFGETSTANVFLLGVAYQAGALPVSAANIERALEINGVSVDRNVAAFRWGRAWCHSPDSLAAVVDAHTDTTSASLPTRLARRIDALGLAAPTDDLVRMLTADLVDYQSANYAARFLDAIVPIADVDNRLSTGDHRLTEAASRNLHKLMAYKDEYEVARLLLGPEADRAARTVGGRRTKVTWHLHPPALKSIGLDRKIRLGPSARPIMKFLASAKRLRGTPIDPFGHAHVRRLERELREEFIATLAELTERIDEINYDLAVRIVELPDGVRGYEDLKVRRAAEYRVALAESMQALRRPGADPAGHQELSHQTEHPPTKDSP